MPCRGRGSFQPRRALCHGVNQRPALVGVRLTLLGAHTGQGPRVLRPHGASTYARAASCAPASWPWGSCVDQAAGNRWPRVPVMVLSSGCRRSSNFFAAASPKALGGAERLRLSCSVSLQGCSDCWWPQESPFSILPRGDCSSSIPPSQAWTTLRPPSLRFQHGLPPAANLAESTLNSPAWPREGPGEIVSKQEKTWLGFSSKRNKGEKKINHESKKKSKKG